jgi:hypothetical protein
VLSRRLLRPIRMMKAPIIKGHVLSLLRPKHMSSLRSLRLLMDLKDGGLREEPQFVQIFASSKFSVPHFVQ